VDLLLSQRESCSFAAGDRASTALGLTEEERKRIPIEHVIVMMKENRSFDHVFGGLAKLQPEADVAPATFQNLDRDGKVVTPFHLDSTCVTHDPGHQWNAMHTQVNDGAMDGFVKSAADSTGTDGHFVMGYYDERDLPFYHFLANTFAIADRYFASARTGTFPNRDYLLLGTSDGVRDTQYLKWPSPSLPTIFDRLTDAGISWRVYADDHPLEETLNNTIANWEKENPWYPLAKLFEDFENDTLPSVVFADGSINGDDEHPTANVQNGEAWTRRFYEAARASNAWDSLAILLTYDEAGGFADHVPPSNHACVARPEDSDFHELGVRVPLVVISPGARRHYVSHVQKEHTSLTRFIEAVFDLPALTARDANSDALLDMFDFACQPAVVADAPAAGSEGCVHGIELTVDKTTFASGEPIVVHFAGGPANSKDWIAAYPRYQSVLPGSTIWKYAGSDTHSAPGSGKSEGSVTLDASAANESADWPLQPGSSWTLYFLLDDGYTAVDSIDIEIAP
jgi:phospholipase C